MKTEQAEQHLAVIRTLMERSTIYRRALGPVMVFVGALASLAAILGWYTESRMEISFVGVWVATCLVALLGALWLTRRAAIHEKEPFWSAPTRRVAQAFLPAMIAGAVLTLAVGVWANGAAIDLVAFWALFYGCALHAAGMFAPRTLRRAGYVFLLCGAVQLLAGGHGWLLCRLSPHLQMGVIFGGVHLAGGAYLLLTETRPRKP